MASQEQHGIDGTPPEMQHHPAGMSHHSQLLQQSSAQASPFEARYQHTSPSMLEFHQPATSGHYPDNQFGSPHFSQLYGNPHTPGPTSKRRHESMSLRPRSCPRMQNGYEGFEDDERVGNLENENESLRSEVAALKGTVEAHSMAIAQLQECADAVDVEDIGTSGKMDNRVTQSVKQLMKGLVGIQYMTKDDNKKGYTLPDALQIGQLQHIVGGQMSRLAPTDAIAPIM
ncbi:hypothetical protein FIBSPDRAFT_884134 [Athelia psychrophila]|uniref:Uncharacterized protein n=1 Tax=Athelia psychrophila TaxID=1759441 RepID=A0A166TGY3_9AGAM|nr:hypothetical protein FIBSPDRAFT_884134 [Fibularhizoctonia sp. CBS 109695]